MQPRQPRLNAAGDGALPRAVENRTSTAEKQRQYFVAGRLLNRRGTRGGEEQAE
jgi:hypothetical protein